jgi:hypothetical protein
VVAGVASGFACVKVGLRPRLRRAAGAATLTPLRLRLSGNQVGQLADLD